MKPLRRNQQPFYYAKQVESEPLEDASGLNGQYGVMYGVPVKSWGNMAPTVGEKNTHQFGETLDYDHVLMPESGCEIDDYSVVWWGCDDIPRRNPDGSFSPPWTHEVKKVARSLNHETVALRQVNIR